MKYLYILMFIFVCNLCRSQEFEHKGLILQVCEDQTLALMDIDTMYFYQNGETCCNVPKYVKYNGKRLPITIVKHISPCNMIRKIVLPSSVTRFFSYAFAHNTASEIIIKSNVELISEGTFISCKNLKKIEVPKSVKRIKRNAFSYCTSLEKIIIKGKTDIEDHAFFGCSGIKKFNIPDGVNEFHMLSLYGCDGIEKLYLPKSVDSLCVWPLKSLQHIVVDRKNKHFKSIKDVLYTRNREMLVLYPSGSTRKHYEIDDSVRIIGRKSFEGSDKLGSVVLPLNLEVIEECAFSRCSSLNHVKFPSHDFLIREYAFYGCEKLINVHFEYMPHMEKHSFDPNIIVNKHQHD